MNNSIVNRLALATIAALLAVSVPGWADESAQTDKAAALEQRMEEARTRLALTDEQVEAVTPILEESWKKQAEILDKHGINLDAEQAEGDRKRPGLRKLRSLRGDMDAVREALLEDLSEVLDDEQIAEFKKMQDERRAEMREHLSS